MLLGHDPVDRAVREDRVVAGDPLADRGGQDVGAVDAVLARDHRQGRRPTGTRLQPERDRRGDERQHARADRGRHEVGGRDRGDHRIRIVVAVERAVVVDDVILRPAPISCTR